ncbi:hypothetical protein BDK51DRAFT_46250 [Blyttiomyces helicus]|uniref:Uncharacterized protein n=1 Tax=Blyttiomyces helicus TaxID=388810 RepID=A0A4P9WDV3_9FUNG|nr:hypothetical protein BDK51DRAFT_46250 [Blyttiomyces helicus]|eukprot:RKO90891.1 hypothetical protein BDK51DRAFT_46250 [Blyttiomyces helicus]
MTSFAANSDTEELSGAETGHAIKDPRPPSDLSGSEENNELDLVDGLEWNDHSKELERVEESPYKKSQSESRKKSHSRHKFVEESAKRRKLEVSDDDKEEEEEQEKGNGSHEPAKKIKLVEASGNEADEARPVPKRGVGRPRIHPPQQGPPKPRGRPRKNPDTEPRLPSKKYHSKSAATSAASSSCSKHAGYSDDLPHSPPSCLGDLADRFFCGLLARCPLEATRYEPRPDPCPVAATSSASSIAFTVGQDPPAAATRTSPPLGALNKASVDRNIVEQQSVKCAKELAVEQNLTHLLPWITLCAFPAGLRDDSISHRLTLSDKAFKNADRKKAGEEAARKEAEEEAARKKAEEEAARKKAEEEAARKKAEEEATRKKAGDEAARAKAKEEAARKKAKEEAARKKAEEDEQFIKFMQSEIERGLW